MSPIPFVVGLSEIYRIARRQENLLEEGRPEEAISLLKARREVMGRMHEPTFETTRRLLPLCHRILAADERIYSLVAALRATTIHRLRNLQASDHVSFVQRPSGASFVPASRYLDLQK